MEQGKALRFYYNEGLLVKNEIMTLNAISIEIFEATKPQEVLSVEMILNNLTDSNRYKSAFEGDSTSTDYQALDSKSYKDYLDTLVSALNDWAMKAVDICKEQGAPDVTKGEYKFYVRAHGVKSESEFDDIKQLEQEVGV